MEVICVQMATSPSREPGLSITATGVAHVKWQAGVLSIAQLVLLARQELFLISYESFVILLVVT